MRTKTILVMAAWIIAVAAGEVLADYLEVSRSANVKAEPSGDAVMIERAEPGDRLKLLDDGAQTNGYYKVEPRLHGGEGWIYRTLVRRYAGDIPEEPGESGVTGPFLYPSMQLTEAEKLYAQRHLRLGKPEAVFERVREGYVTAQDVRLKIPLWVQYELSRDDLDGPADREGKDFSADTSIPGGARAERSDYRNSGYDQGHMAPAADMVRSWSAMDESFLLSNAAPQVGVGFNRRIWLSLERAVRGWVEQRGDLTIITGPVFEVAGDSVRYDVIGESHVAVPTHFYKIVVDANDSENSQALAFVMPNRNLGDDEINGYLSSIDQIESLTGLDFLSGLPVDVQNLIESQPASQIW